MATTLNELVYALYTAQPGERVRVQLGVLSKWSAVDGVTRYPHYHLGAWLDADLQNAQPMKVLNA